MPSQRFRDEKGAIAGQDRDGSKHIREGLKQYFAEFGFDPSLTGSTRGFGRDLLSWEQDLVKLKNRGKHTDRAGKRALDEETREKNDQKLLKKIERGRKKLEAGAPKSDRASGKRPGVDRNDDVQDSNATPERDSSEGRLGRGRGKPVISEPQRYGTHEAPSSLDYNPDLLKVGGRSSPSQNAGTIGGNQQAPYFVDGQSMGGSSMSSHARVGLQNDARLGDSQQGFRGQPWFTQDSVHSGYYPEGHYHQQYSRVKEDTPPRRNALQTTPQDYAPFRGFNRFEAESAQYVSPQTTRKRDRPHSESEVPQNSLGPGGKRRQMQPRAFAASGMVGPVGCLGGDDGELEAPTN